MNVDIKTLENHWQYVCINEHGRRLQMGTQNGQYKYDLHRTVFGWQVMAYEAGVVVTLVRLGRKRWAASAADIAFGGGVWWSGHVVVGSEYLEQLWKEKK